MRRRRQRRRRRIGVRSVAERKMESKHAPHTIEENSADVDVVVVVDVDVNVEQTK